MSKNIPENDKHKRKAIDELRDLEYNLNDMLKKKVSLKWLEEY